MRPIDLIVGSITQMNDDCRAGWQAFYRKDAECDELKKEIEKLKKKLFKLTGK